MRENFSELEFQFALMMGYYTIFSKQDGLNLYMPTSSEEKDQFASDWFYENAQGVHFYLQFKKSAIATQIRIRNRKQLFEQASSEDLKAKRPVFRNDNKGVFEIVIYKNKDNIYQQHNLLFNKSQHFSSLAYYVAPIFTSRFELQSNLIQWLKRKNYNNKLIYKLFYREGISPMEYESLTENFGFFKDVIYIHPHTSIDDDNSHYYCFNKNREVSFHSDILPLEKNGFDFSSVIKEVENKLVSGKTSTVIEAADINLQVIKNHFTENNISVIRDYKIERIFDTQVKDSENIISILEGFKTSKKYRNYVIGINKLFQELFDIQVGFIYPRF